MVIEEDEEVMDSRIMSHSIVAFKTLLHAINKQLPESINFAKPFKLPPNLYLIPLWKPVIQLGGLPRQC